MEMLPERSAGGGEGESGGALGEGKSLLSGRCAGWAPSPLPLLSFPLSPSGLPGVPARGRRGAVRWALAPAALVSRAAVGLRWYKAFILPAEKPQGPRDVPLGGFILFYFLRRRMCACSLRLWVLWGGGDRVLPKKLP